LSSPTAAAELPAASDEQPPITVSVTGSLAGYTSVTKTSAPTAKVEK
jgi:hypothetical protein